MLDLDLTSYGNDYLENGEQSYILQGKHQGQSLDISYY